MKAVNPPSLDLINEYLKFTLVLNDAIQQAHQDDPVQTLKFEDYSTDEEGYLLNSSDWNENFANLAAKQDGLELTEDHWRILRFLQEYYEEYQVSPATRVLVKAIRKKWGKEKGNSRYLYELFPFGPGKQAIRYAGLYKPTIGI